MKNNKCISLSLYGEKIWYYLPLLFSLDCIKRSNLDFDIVVRSTEKTKKFLLDILNYEHLLFDNLKFKIMPRESEYSRGMFWRYHEILDNDYDLIYFGDSDVTYTYEYWWILKDFFKKNIPFGTYLTMTCNGHLLSGG